MSKYECDVCGDSIETNLYGFPSSESLFMVAGDLYRLCEDCSLRAQDLWRERFIEAEEEE